MNKADCFSMANKSYIEYKDKHPELDGCFFAFSNSQFAEGIKKHGLEGQKLYDGGAGLFGTKEGIQKFIGFYDNLNKEIAENCDPQEVYDFEFSNHECGYTHDDTGAIKIVAATFGDEKAKTVKRRFACVKVEELKYN